MKSVTGTCMFCGQTRLVMVEDEADDREIGLEAARYCHCEEGLALQYREEQARAKEESKMDAEGMIYELFKEDHEEVIDLLLQGIRELSEYNIDAMTIKIDETTTAKVSLNAKGLYKVERTDKSKKTRVSDY